MDFYIFGWQMLGRILRFIRKVQLAIIFTFRRIRLGLIKIKSPRKKKKYVRRYIKLPWKKHYTEVELRQRWLDTRLVTWVWRDGNSCSFFFYFIGKCFALPSQICYANLAHCEQRRGHLTKNIIIQYCVMSPFVRICSFLFFMI